MNNSMIEILYFTAIWCGPCKMFSPVLDEVTQQLGISIKKLDADTNKAMVDQCNVRGIPTMIFLKNGQEVARRTGAMSKSQLVSLVQSL